MRVETIDTQYFQDMFSDASMRCIFSERARIESWLATEVALAVAQEEIGLIPAGTAQKIEAAAKLENLDIPAMKEEFDKIGFPILPFIAQLNQACDEETARWVHYGATTQDILDTGTVLQMRDAAAWVELQLKAVLKLWRI